MTLESVCGGIGAGYGTLDAVFQGGQTVNEEVGGGAGPHADDFAFRYKAERRLGDLFFQRILVHEIVLSCG